MIFGAIGGMKIGRGNRSTRRKPTPALLCPPQNPTWQTRFRTPDRRVRKPATNGLSYGTAIFSPISSPLMTRRVTVEVFDPASTRVFNVCCFYNKHHVSCYFYQYFCLKRGTTIGGGGRTISVLTPKSRLQPVWSWTYLLYKLYCLHFCSSRKICIIHMQNMCFVHW
jgi:hypothetical protein